MALAEGIRALLVDQVAGADSGRVANVQRAARLTFEVSSNY